MERSRYSSGTSNNYFNVWLKYSPYFGNCIYRSSGTVQVSTRAVTELHSSAPQAHNRHSWLSSWLRDWVKHWTVYRKLDLLYPMRLSILYDVCWARISSTGYMEMAGPTQHNFCFLYWTRVQDPNCFYAMRVAFSIRQPATDCVAVNRILKYFLSTKDIPRFWLANVPKINHFQNKMKNLSFTNKVEKNYSSANRTQP